MNSPPSKKRNREQRSNELKYEIIKYFQSLSHTGRDSKEETRIVKI